MVDLSNPDSLLGTFNGRPVDTLTVKALCEYLWTLRHGWSKALSSHTWDAGTDVAHTIFDVHVRRGDYGMHDDAILTRRQYTVSTATGMILVRETVERTVTGRYHPNNRSNACGG